MADATLMAAEEDLRAEIQRLQSQLERERAIRLQTDAIAVSRLRDLYEKQRQVQLLAKIAAASNQTSSVKDALHFVVVQICEFNNWQVGHSYLAEGSGEALCLRSTGMWFGPQSERIEEFRRATEELDFRAGVGLPGQVLATGRPLWLHDVTESNNFPRRAVALTCGLKGATAFPVLSGDDVVAVLEFFAGDAREPDDALLELMAQIGAQLGRVIERQRADDRLRERAEELLRARDEAKAADVAKSAFLANMSHELRTPLNAILGFSEILKTELLGPINNARYRSYAESIFASGSHLLGLINDVLDFAKLDAACLDLSEEVLNLREIILDCMRFLEPQASKGKVTVLETIDPELPGLRADRRRLRQIFLNLLSNAVKFTGEGGEVRISATCTAQGLDIRVTDTGIGMSAEQIPLALERFGQVDNKLARKYEGTGLGLPLTKQLLGLHGGALAIESTLGRGTTVTASFPPERIVSLYQAA